MKKLKMKSSIIILALLVLSFLIVGCSNQEEENTLNEGNETNDGVLEEDTEDQSANNEDILNYIEDDEEVDLGELI